MHPVLFEIPIFGGIQLHTYGLMVALGFLAALLWIRYRSPRENLDPKKMTDFAFWMILTGIIGARLTSVIVEQPSLFLTPWEILKIWEGGLVFYGGLIACIFVSIFYMRKHRWNFWQVADVIAPGLAIGHALGRVGCLMAGCCHGSTCPVSSWYTVIFPEGVGSLAPTGVPLYNTQIYEAVTELLVFLFLAYKSSHKRFHGQILALYLFLNSLFRFIIEFYRGDTERGFVDKQICLGQNICFSLSTSQFIALILASSALMIYVFKRKGGSNESS